MRELAANEHGLGRGVSGFGCLDLRNENARPGTFLVHAPSCPVEVTASQVDNQFPPAVFLLLSGLFQSGGSTPNR